jgi:hypothetical protein
VGLALGPALLADEPPASPKATPKKPVPGKFIRIKKDAKGEPVALQTAIARYVPASSEGGLTVDLVSVVHIGDEGYYEKLNDQLDQYDVVLYELVAPPGTRFPKGGRRDSDNPLAMLQHLATTVLDLESQVEQIDYTRKNFVHADLSPEQMAEAVRKRGDTGVTLFLSIAADLLRQQNLQEMERQKDPGREEPDIDVLELLLDPNSAVKLKRLLAQQLAALESPAGGLGNTLNTILISDRNEAAMRVFQKELARGRKKVAIFFGAGHMPDFERRLREDFGLKRAGEQWLTAWDMKLRRSGLGELLKLFGD